MATVNELLEDEVLKTLKKPLRVPLVIRERDESLNTLLKLFQTEREFVLISFSDGVQRRYKNSKNVQSCIKKRLVRASQTKLVRSYNLTKF